MRFPKASCNCVNLSSAFFCYPLSSTCIQYMIGYDQTSLKLPRNNVAEESNTKYCSQEDGRAFTRLLTFNDCREAERTIKTPKDTEQKIVRKELRQKEI